MITGVGLVCPLGCGHEGIWQKIMSNRQGISSLTDRNIEIAGSGVTAAGFVPWKSSEQSSSSSNHQTDGPTFEDDGYSEEQLFGRLVSRELSLATQYAICASDLALKHAGLIDESRCEQDATPTLKLECGGVRAGAAIASGGIGSLSDIVEGGENLKLSYKKLSPYFVPKVLMNMAAGHVSIKYGLKGPVNSVATACAAGAHSIGDAYNYIRMGYADVMLAGGTEACIDKLSVAGFARMKALSSNAVSAKASRPFDGQRDGFVIGEGAGVLVLEELSVALRRGAPIIAEVLGFGISGDAHHATHPPPNGAGAERSMRQALAFAGIAAEQVGYVNAHATSTPVGDAIEVRAIERVFGSSEGRDRRPLFVSSTKGATGHLLGAAGAVETAFTAFALRDGIIPATLNLDNESENCRWSSPHIHHVPHTSITYPRDKTLLPDLSFALKNSFGFGGTNVALVLGKYFP